MNGSERSPFRNRYSVSSGNALFPTGNRGRCVGLATSCSATFRQLLRFSATFEIFGNFLEFWQLLEFSATLGFLRFFEATFFTFWATLVSFR